MKITISHLDWHETGVPWRIDRGILAAWLMLGRYHEVGETELVDEVNVDPALDTVFALCNYVEGPELNPTNGKRSLSVGDMVTVTVGETTTEYICMPCGWETVPTILAGQQLSSANRDKLH